MPWATTGDVELYYEVSGDAGPWLVFSHGGGSNHLSWWQQVAHFKASCRCLTYDQRGFGRSSGEVATDFEQNPADLLALMDLLEIERAVLIGQSLGGTAVFPIALDHPDRVLGLVMAGTDVGIPSVAMWEHRLERMRNRPSGKTSYATDFPQREPALAFLYDHIGALSERPGETKRTTLPSLQPADRDLSSLRVPTLFVRGSQDPLMTAAGQAHAVALLPGTGSAEVAGAGHSAYFERAQAFNEIVGRFVRELPRSR
jgi:pimeloyl-ACP methyl ester carboxylesterase